MRTNFTLRKTIQWVMIVVLIAWAGGFFAPTPARADIAPPAAPYLGGVEPFEYQDTEVQMLYERVEMDLSDESGQLHVLANFGMLNTGSDDENMQVVFPLSSLGGCNPRASYRIEIPSFVVKVNGNSVNASKIITEYPDPQCANFGEEFEWMAFDVSFPIDMVVPIQVEYVMSGSGNWPYATFLYVLKTGAAWKGNILQADFVFRSPYTLDLESLQDASPAGYKVLGNEVHWHLENFEPKYDIEIAIFAPGFWRSVVAEREKLSADPANAEAWMNLARLYREVAIFHVHKLVDREYADKAAEAYREAIRSQPSSPDYHAELADLLWLVCKDQEWDTSVGSTLSRNSACLQPVLAEISATLALNTRHELARAILAEIQEALPELTFTPPPPFPRTSTPTITETPTPSDTPTSSFTPTITRTSTPSNTPRPTLTPSVTRTRRPTRTATLLVATATPIITATSTSQPSATHQPTALPLISPTAAVSAQSTTSFPSWLAGFLLASFTFAAGIFVGRNFLPKPS
jgi:hypothetical protein